MYQIKPRMRFFTTSLLLLFLVCSPASRHKWLTTFFEGVPDPKAQKEGKEQIIARAAGEKHLQKMLSGSIHKPYVERKCDACHPTGGGAGEVRTRGFCLECHRKDGKMPVRESAIVTPENAWLHEPVAKNLCLECHNGHRSKARYLVREKPTAKVCMKCHKDKKEKFAGQNMDCTACHNPHYAESKDEHFLKNTPEQLCLDCHVLPDENYWQHGPYALKKCNICHDPHGSAQEHQLTMAVPDLCLACHDMESYEPVEDHKDLKRPCTDCHDPHYASDPKSYLLKEKSNAKPMILKHEEYAIVREATEQEEKPAPTTSGQKPAPQKNE